MSDYRRRLTEGDVLKQRYRIVKWLGEGGMGTVFLAEDLRLPGKRWAVKETFSFGADAAGFKRETDMLARLQHPRLPQIVDSYPADEENGYAYVVMEYIEGRTLEAALRKQGRFAVEATVRVGKQLAETLAYLHGQQPEPVVFRDVKPSNIMLDDAGNIRLIDFGIARRYKPDRVEDTVPLGTVGFAAPEQLRGEQSDSRSDLYAVGAVLDAMLRGGRSGTGSSAAPLLEARPDVPQPLAQLVERLLEERSEQRLQSASVLLDELQRLTLPNRPLSAGKASATVQLPPKLILIGSLYPGAGSTVAALALAYTMRRFGIPHAVCEHPAILPELFALLYGEKTAPDGYVFAADRIRSASPAGPEWTDGHTLWVPSHPDADPESWEPRLTFEWLYEVRRSIVVCDVSHCWSEPSVSMLISKADELLVTVDPTPSKLTNARVKSLLQRLAAANDSGRPRVSWVVNRDAPSSSRSAWLDMLPNRPAVFLPAFPPDRMLKAQWRGTGIPAGERERAAIERAYHGLLCNWFPDWPIKKNVATRRIFGIIIHKSTSRMRKHR